VESFLLLEKQKVLVVASYINKLFTFPNQVFNTRTYVSSHVGFILAERIGTTFSSSDPLIAFISHGELTDRNFLH
jgi:hypothetical protein